MHMKVLNVLFVASLLDCVQPFSPTASHFGVASSQRRAHNHYEFALLFDCDGVLLETEELHRVAYNEAFQEFGLTTVEGAPVHWSTEYYDMLQNTIGGGKQKMTFHFQNTASPRVNNESPPLTSPEALDTLIDQLQTYKNKVYQRIMKDQAEPRPGVLQLMDEALQDDRIAVGVCSASTKESALQTLQYTLGSARVSRLDVCILGDDVAVKKPDPLIYNVAREALGIIDPTVCVVIEDSLIGLRAAKGAGMKCVITYTTGTGHCDFYGEGADAVVPDLGSRNVTLDSIFGPLRERGLDATIMEDIRDPVMLPVAKE